MKFCEHVPNSPKIKELKSYNPYLLKKMVFLAFKTCLYYLNQWKKASFSTLHVMILKLIKSENLRFGGHVEIQIKYKILHLEIPKRTSTLKNLICFEERLF